MRILQLGKFYPIKGGVEKVMFDLMSDISKKGIQCDMLCASENKSQKNEEIIINSLAKLIIVPTFTEIAKTKISSSMIFKLRDICNSYDIIHIHHPDPMAALALFLSRYKGRVVLHWHSDILAQKKLLKIYDPLQRWLIKRACVIIGTTENYLQNSKPLINFKNKCLAVPIGIEDISNKLGIFNNPIDTNVFLGKKIIFSLGRLVPYKGFEYLIESAKYLDDDFIILIGGEGQLKKTLQDVINNENLNNKVRLLGYLSEEDVLQYYAVCDIFCMSSIEKTEAFGIVQIEAMCLSKPIISTKIEGSGVSWVNQNGITGINVNIKNGKEIADAAKKITSNVTYYRKTSLASRNRFIDNFTLDKMSKSILDIYKNILIKKS
ncbi:glycosyltransferase [Chryseobacterium sp. CFBP8996]|uniref:glycosyltransferase n=1 Tax=Chryseobacterium sp. CFBP8996 TaxID=3096529 RepID=UPI002A6B8015|nr:glycosyltransferase [Chryseobacterium sp. CFBP8996]MDY0933027.1 glycosyltransferase [Chryseobacterium sp. CFBP8996]